MQHFKDKRSIERDPVWCADRYGQTYTFLPDRRVVLVGGEHEDSYDPDFCIYNDVWVIEPDGKTTVLGYPKADFPPTDFHTATLVGNMIWLIGNLGYATDRVAGRTQVFALDTRTWHISAVETRGEDPGWISRHSATLIGADTIQVSNGTVETKMFDGNKQIPNNTIFHLCTLKREWQRI